MLQKFKSIFIFILAFFWTSQEKNNNKQVSKKQNLGKNHVELAGRWYFKRDILDKLDLYFIHIKELKKEDKRIYKLFSKIGACISNDLSIAKAGNSVKEITAFDKTSFGAVALTQDRNQSEIVYAQLIYFYRFEKIPSYVEKTSGTVYEVGVLHCIKEENLSKLSKFWVSVEGTKVRKLKARLPHVQILPGGAAITHTRWQYPQDLRELDKAWNFNEETINISPEQIFSWAVETYQNNLMDIRIRVSKNNLVGAFSVDMLRLPYFFKDRDHVIVNNKKKRIFHIVRTHRRVLSEGRETNVKCHFRGLRKFSWNGYNINITVPGLHHNDPLDMPFGAIDILNNKDFNDRKTISPKKLGRILDWHMNV
jgi:hypothetical protein